MDAADDFLDRDIEKLKAVLDNNSFIRDVYDSDKESNQLEHDSDVASLRSFDTHAEAEENNEIVKPLATCLALNRQFQTWINNCISKVSLILDKNRERQEQVKNDFEEIANQKIVQRKRNHTMFARPYFRDYEGSFPKANVDTLKKETTGELDPFVRPSKSWSQEERRILEQSVKTDRLKKLLKPFMNKKQLTCERLNVCVPSSKEELDLKNKLSQIEDEIMRIKESSAFSYKCGDLEDLEEIDWIKIANIDLKGLKTAEACKSYWSNAGHPSINTSKWTLQEDEKLVKLVAEHKLRNWKQISNELGTNRTAFMCLQRYQSKFNPVFQTKWTPNEDMELEMAVKKQLSKSVHVDWQSVSECFESRSGAECMHRWRHVQKKVEKRTKWTREMDRKLKDAVQLFDTNWDKISNFVPGKNSVQCRDRWINKLDDKIKSGRWTSTEDKLLWKAVTQLNLRGKWATISKLYLPNRSDNQILIRYKRLIKWKSHDGCSDSEDLDVPTNKHLRKRFKSSTNKKSHSDDSFEDESFDSEDSDEDDDDDELEWIDDDHDSNNDAGGDDDDDDNEGSSHDNDSYKRHERTSNDTIWKRKSTHNYDLRTKRAKVNLTDYVVEYEFDEKSKFDVAEYLEEQTQSCLNVDNNTNFCDIVDENVCSSNNIPTIPTNVVSTEDGQNERVNSSDEKLIFQNTNDEAMVLGYVKNEDNIIMMTDDSSIQFNSSNRTTAVDVQNLSGDEVLEESSSVLQNEGQDDGSEDGTTNELSSSVVTQDAINSRLLEKELIAAINSSAAETIDRSCELCFSQYGEEQASKSSYTSCTKEKFERLITASLKLQELVHKMSSSSSSLSINKETPKPSSNMHPSNLNTTLNSSETNIHSTTTITIVNPTLTNCSTTPSQNKTSLTPLSSKKLPLPPLPPNYATLQAFFNLLNHRKALILEAGILHFSSKHSLPSPWERTQFEEIVNESRLTSTLKSDNIIQIDEDNYSNKVSDKAVNGTNVIKTEPNDSSSECPNANMITNTTIDKNNHTYEDDNIVDGLPNIKHNNMINNKVNGCNRNDCRNNPTFASFVQTLAQKHLSLYNYDDVVTTHYEAITLFQLIRESEQFQELQSRFNSMFLWPLMCSLTPNQNNLPP